MDMYIDMRHDMARELRHGLFIQHCNESYELVLIDLKTTRKGVSWQHMYATRATHLDLCVRLGLVSFSFFALSLAPLSLGSCLPPWRWHLLHTRIQSRCEQRPCGCGKAGHVARSARERLGLSIPCYTRAPVGRRGMTAGRVEARRASCGRGHAQNRWHDATDAEGTFWSQAT